MNQIDLKKKITEVLNAVLKISKTNKIENLSISNTDAWDSLKHISIIMTLEEEVNIKFTNDEIVEATSFENILKIVSKKINTN